MPGTKTYPRTVHKVEGRQLQRYLDFLVPDVQAECGTIFEPDRSLVITPDMPRCENCFPKRPKYAWAA